MKNLKLIALIGKAGSGKDTLMQHILAETDIHEIISCTTRPQREGEVDGKNYYFLSEYEFFKKKNAGLMLETTCFNMWYYGTSIDGLNKDKINIGVFNPDGINSILEHKDIDVQVYYITASDKTRMLRQLNRENNPNVKEIVRRYKTDEEDFSDLHFDYQILTNETPEDLDRNVQTIIASI